MAVQVRMTELKAKVEEGWKRDALAEHYGLPKQQMSALLKEARLRIRKFHAPKFELIDDEVQIQDEVMEVTQETTETPTPVAVTVTEQVTQEDW